MNQPKQIESESKFVWRQIIFLIKLPFLFILALLGKKKFSELARPLGELYEFIFQPKITIAVIVVNLLLFILEIFYFSQEQLISLAFQPSHIIEGNLLPIIASWFLHASVAHLLGNMLFLYIFGRIVEKDFGWKILLIYFGSAIISSSVSALFGQGGIGASGAIAGLIATAMLMHPFYFTYLVAGIPIPIVVLGWLAIIADVTGILVLKNDNIGHFAHLGGYIAVSVIMFFLGKENKEKMRKGLLINVAFALAVALVWLLMR